MTALIHQGERRSTANSEFRAIRSFMLHPPRAAAAVSSGGRPRRVPLHSSREPAMPSRASSDWNTL